jgi:hypothetical protein
MSKSLKSIIAKFLEAVRTWKIYKAGVQSANKQNRSKAKSILMKAMFFWRKQAEALKAEIDELRSV